MLFAVEVVIDVVQLTTLDDIDVEINQMSKVIVAGVDAITVNVDV